MIKYAIGILLAFIITFGVWYLVGWFLSNEINPLLWPTYGKIIFLIFATTSFSGTVDEITKQ